MNHIEKMIAEMCPNGVESHSLKILCESLSKGILTKKELEKNGQYPVVNGGKRLYGHYSKYNNEGDAICIAAVGEAGFVTYMKEKFWAGPLCHPYRSRDQRVLLTKFLFYFFKQKEEYIRRRFVTKACIPAINKSVIEKFLISVPPLPIQKAIVAIFDKFTALISLLEEELKLRIMQYKYYRKKLLTFDQRIPLVALRDITILKRGIRVVRKQLDTQWKYPVYQNSLTPLGYYKKSTCEANTTFIIVGGAAGKIGYSFIDFWAADDCCYFQCSEDVNSRFLYYSLQCQYKYIQSQVRRAAVPRLSRSIIEKIYIPLPPLPIQKAIVAILDKFDTIVNDRKGGLSAEIAARKQQYEYYRDKLLSFPEAPRRTISLP